MEYVAKVKERVYPVGRLDFASEGLIILTNDGDFTDHMTKAGVIPKVYHVKLASDPAERDMDRLRRGIYLDNERLAPCEITPMKSGPKPWYEVTLVDKLRRVKIGTLEDKKLRAGEWRFLTENEVRAFQDEFAKKKAPKKKVAHPQ
jgi:16S rRNA U516 pseudouridylate synthase RsuA-like enzyme